MTVYRNGESEKQSQLGYCDLFVAPFPIIAPIPELLLQGQTLLAKTTEDAPDMLRCEEILIIWQPDTILY